MRVAIVHPSSPLGFAGYGRDMPRCITLSSHLAGTHNASLRPASSSEEAE